MQNRAVTTVALHPDAPSLARTVRFVESLGGPLIVVSAAHAPAWNGTCDAAGNVIFGTAPCDYDRACAANDGIIDVDAGKALVLATPDTSAFVRRERGALIVRWVGADDAETLISAALALGNDDFDTEIGVLAHTGGELWLFDSTAHGKTLASDARAAVTLAAGDYVVRMCTEWQGAVTGSDGAAHEVMVQVFQLTKA